MQLILLFAYTTVQCRYTYIYICITKELENYKEQQRRTSEKITSAQRNNKDKTD